MSRIRRRNNRIAAAAVAVTMLLSGCSLFPGGGPAGDVGTSSAPESVIGAVPENLKSFYSQAVAWTECEEGFTCTTVKVPLDYDRPSAESIDLAVIRSGAADSDVRGSILLNPGGPGVSGYTAVKDGVKQYTTEKVRKKYHVIGFDPRGVGRSAAVKCLTDRERDESRNEYVDPDTPSGLSEGRRVAEEFAEKCSRNTGKLLGFVDTESSARDLDILRAVAGDAKLNYLGFSYGTFLGATYADLFPDRVGRLVLDGAMDPTLSNEELTLDQATAFEEAIRSYVESCQQQADCPLGGSVDEGVEKIRALIQSVEESPLTAKDGRTVTVSTFVSGFIYPLYNDANWPVLTAALQDALVGDPTQMLRIADLAAERKPDGTYGSNSNFAFPAYNCLDYPMNDSVPVMRREADKLEQASPTIGKYLGYGALTCSYWKHEPVSAPKALDAAGAAPIVVIGTTGDPATPYKWAVALADQLESAVLLTWEAEGHGAYSRAGSCIKDAVDNYFLDGKVPDDGTTC